VSRLALLVLAGAFALPGCFDPSYPVGLPCGPDRFCPSGQTCNGNDICISTNGRSDGGVDEPDSSLPPGPDANLGLGDLISIDIGGDRTLTLAETHTFVVTGTYESGTQIENNIFVIWESTDNGIVFVDFMGVARPQSAGTATITADFEGRIDTAVLTITPAM